MALSVRNIHLLQVLLLISLVSLTVFILMPFQAALDQSMLEFRQQLVEYIEGKIGRHISYKSISPAILRNLEIRDLSIYNEEDHEEKLLTIRRVKIRYNFFGLFSGNPLSALREVRFENSSLELDTQKDADLLRLIQNLKPDPGSDSDIQQKQDDPRFTVSGRNLKIRVKTARGAVSLNRVFFDLVPNEQSFRLDLSTKADVVVNEERSPLKNMSTDMRVEGNFNPDFSMGTFTLSLESTDTNILQFPELTMFVDYQPERVMIRKIQDREPFDFSLEADLNNRRGVAEFRSEQFIPAKLLSMKGPLKKIDPWLSTVISGSARSDFSFDLQSVEYQGDLQIQANNRYLPVPADADLRFSGTDKYVDFEKGLISSSMGRVSYTGNFDYDSLLPAGQMKVRDFQLSTGDLFNSDLRFYRNGRTVSLKGGARVGGVLFPGISGTVFHSGSRWEFDVDLPLENGTVESSLVSLQGGYYQDSGIFQFGGLLSDVPLNAVIRASSGNEPPEILAREKFRINSSLFLYTSGENFTFYLPDCVIDKADDPMRSMTVQVSGSGDRFDINLDSLRFDDYRGNGKFALEKTAEGYDFSLNADFQETPYSFTGRLSGRQLTVTGNYLDSFFIDFGSPGRFRIITRDMPLPLPQGTSRLDINARGLFGTPDGWNIWLEDTRVRNLPIGGGGNNLSVTLFTDGSEASLYKIAYSDSVSAVSGNGFFNLQRKQGKELEYSLDLSSLPVTGSGWLQLASDEGEEAYQLLANLTEDEIESDLSFTNAPLSRFGDIPLRGNLSGDVTLRGMPSDPDVFVRFEMNEGEFNRDPFGISTVFSLEDKKLRIREFNLDYLGMSISQGTGLYMLEEGDLSFNSRMQMPLQGQIYSSDVSLTARTAPLAGINDVSDLFSMPFDGRIDFFQGLLGPKPVDDWEFEFGYDGKLFAFTGGPGRSISGTMNNDREFFLSLDKPLPVALRLRGAMKGGDISAVIETVNLQVEQLQGGIKFPFFNLTSGELNGVDIRVEGPLNDPDFFGTLKAVKISARSEVIPEQIGPFEGVLLLDGKSLHINDLELSAGIGTLAADLSFDIEHWIPATYDINLVTTGKRGLHLKTDIGQLIIDGYVKGNFRVNGDQLATDLSGDLELSSAVITVTNEELAPPEHSSHILRTNFTFTTGRGVEFLWPSTTLPILRSFAKTGNDLKISSDSSNDSFNIDGEIDIQGGIVLYFQRNFIIKEGRVRFSENEVKFDPVISARAEIREIDADGETVQIYLILDDRPFSQFTPRFESVPSLSDVEIAALLGYSVFGSSIGEAIDPTDALLQTSDLLVNQLGIIRSFEQSMKEILNLDLFSIRTQLFQNILLQRIGGTEGDSTVTQETSTSAIGRYLDNTTLFLGKYFGDDVFLEAMLQVQSNEQFFSDFSADSSYALETEISVEWKTPFFLFDVAVYPDFRDIVSSITTAEVGLSWSLSF